jgi:hypothetical protein
MEDATIITQKTNAFELQFTSLMPVLYRILSAFDLFFTKSDLLR